MWVKWEFISRNALLESDADRIISKCKQTFSLFRMIFDQTTEFAIDKKIAGSECCTIAKKMIERLLRTLKDYIM